MNNLTYLVPFDFTEITMDALKQALRLSHQTGANIEIVHLVKSANQLEDGQKKLKESIVKMGIQNDPKISYKTYVGNIFKDIYSKADASKAKVIFMGTHGKKGLQKLFGSNAIKVIQSSKIPFVISQQFNAVSEIKRIAVPLDLTKESTRILKFTVDLAKQINAEVDLLGLSYKDEFQKNKIKLQLLAASKFLTSHQIKSKVSLLEGKDSYNELILKHVLENDIDLIAAAYFSDSLFPQFDSFMQSLITNTECIPVMTVSSDLVEVG